MVPASTYRVQVSPSFDLRAAAGVADYLAALGADCLYSSPLLQAAPGSTHGYDVVDFTRVSDALGGEEGRRELVAGLRAAGLSLLVDIVPNHTGVRVPSANRMWWDVLRYGSGSAYARWFDIDWSRGRLVLPVLGDEQYALDELTIDGDELAYHDHRFPIAPGTRPGSPQQVHDRQHYQLVSWRRGDAELNYRRFFSITDLAGLRVEDPEVFDGVHAEVLRWYAEGGLAGLRVDHPDGLRDPAAYFDRLAAAAPGAWLLAEKILEPGEELPDWPIAGTTGYDALGEVCGLFVDPAGEPGFTALSGQSGDWPGFALACKREVAAGMLTAEVRRLARLVPEADLARLAPAAGLAGPVPAVGPASAPGAAPAADPGAVVGECLVEVLARFGVYRSYLPDGREHLNEALAAAARDRPELGPALAVLAPRLADPADELAQRFQQTSGAVMAKGVEDSAFYRWCRFVALNEVGGDPSRFGVSVADFHAACARRQQRHPYGMTTLSTHDTKRSEDVRARMAVLSELPREWADAVRRWLVAVPLPDPAFGQLLWQTLIGAWPIEPERLHAYAVKAGREARIWTRWEAPDETAETAVRDAIDRICGDLSAEVDAFAARLTPHGWSNALGQKLLQLTMPGVPDTYQGSELWDNSLVDPDNRRPVDYAVRADLLAKLDAGWLPPVDASGAAKLLVVSRALRLRRDAPECFTAYTPVSAAGPAADHLVGFDRGGAVSLATRLPVGLERAGGWRDTTVGLPPGAWHDLLTGTDHEGTARLRALMARYPVALLVRR
ncbi:MAG: malto-oligosyltrehalose synthase [Micromonosporaceae bacterium]